MGPCPGTGMGVAMAGRDTPLMRPMRSSAEAMVAPVLPAEIIAKALPSRTASAARTSDESFIFRTLEPGSALMPITSDAGITSRPSARGSSTSGCPTSATGTPELVDRPVRAGDDLLRRLVPTHRVERDGQASRSSTNGRYSTSMA